MCAPNKDDDMGVDLYLPVLSFSGNKWGNIISACVVKDKPVSPRVDPVMNPLVGNSADVVSKPKLELY